MELRIYPDGRLGLIENGTHIVTAKSVFLSGDMIEVACVSRQYQIRINGEIALLHTPIEA